MQRGFCSARLCSFAASQPMLAPYSVPGGRSTADVQSRLEGSGHHTPRYLLMHRKSGQNRSPAVCTFPSIFLICTLIKGSESMSARGYGRSPAVLWSAPRASGQPALPRVQVPRARPRGPEQARGSRTQRLFDRGTGQKCKSNAENATNLVVST